MNKFENTKQLHGRDKMQKNKKNKRDEIILQDFNLAKSSKARIKYLVLQILKQRPLLSENELIKELYNNVKWVKEYLDKEPKKITYLRYVIWEMSKRGEILKIKIIGDLRRSYYILPSQLPAFKDKIIKIPKKWEKFLEKARAEAQAKARDEEEDWDEEDWEELEELKEEAKEEDWDEDDIEDWDEE